VVKLVQRRSSKQVQLGIQVRDPQHERHPRRGGVGGEGAVGAVVVNELLELGEKGHWRRIARARAYPSSGCRGLRAGHLPDANVRFFEV
jgi:hypothetical protein